MTWREYFKNNSIIFNSPEKFLDEEITVEACLRFIESLTSVTRELSDKIKWHTGLPTKEGAYLVQYENNYTERIIFKNGSFIAKNDITHGDGVVHGSDKYENVTDIVIAWQKIEPYKEEENVRD